jgi:hypothetical protein
VFNTNTNNFHSKFQTTHMDPRCDAMIRWKKQHNISQQAKSNPMRVGGNKSSQHKHRSSSDKWITDDIINLDDPPSLHREIFWGADLRRSADWFSCANLKTCHRTSKKKFYDFCAEFQVIKIMRRISSSKILANFQLLKLYTKFYQINLSKFSS